MNVPKPKKLLDRVRDSLRVKRYAYSADPLSGLVNAVDSSCLLICDRTQTILMDSIGDIGFGITV
jgi:hypothetical protein